MTGRKRTGSSNIQLLKLIDLLKKQKKGTWTRVADDLSRPTRARREINLSKLNRYSKDGEIIIVPGKVLADGIFEKKIEIAAFKFSTGAKNKIEKAGSKLMSIEQLIKKNPAAKGVRILG